MDQHIVQQLITKYLKHAPHTMEWLGSGEANEIVRVDEVIFRFPLNKNAKMELLFEFQLFQKLKLPTHIKSPTALYIDPACKFAVYRYIDGVTLSEPLIQSLPTAQKLKLATTLAKFINEFSMNNQEQLTKLRIESGLGIKFSSIDTWIQSVLSQLSSQDRKAVHDDFAALHEMYSINFPNGLIDQGSFVLHDDLHNGNILFDKVGNIVAVIDFADTAVSNIYNELRCISGMGNDVLQTVIDQLDKKFGDIKIEQVLSFAIFYEMCIVAERVHLLKQHDDRLEEACQFLKYHGYTSGIVTV